MKKSIIKKKKKYFIKKGFIGRFKMPLSNFNFFMIYIIDKMLVLFKYHLNYLKDNIFRMLF